MKKNLVRLIAGPLTAAALAAGALGMAELHTSPAHRAE
jgi:hypothetical protein